MAFRFRISCMGASVVAAVLFAHPVFFGSTALAENESKRNSVTDVGNGVDDGEDLAAKILKESFKFENKWFNTKLENLRAGFLVTKLVWACIDGQKAEAGAAATDLAAYLESHENNPEPGDNMSANGKLFWTAVQAVGYARSGERDKFLEKEKDLLIFGAAATALQIAKVYAPEYAPELNKLTENMTTAQAMNLGDKANNVFKAAAKLFPEKKETDQSDVTGLGEDEQGAVGVMKPSDPYCPSGDCTNQERFETALRLRDETENNPAMVLDANGHLHRPGAAANQQSMLGLTPATEGEFHNRIMTSPPNGNGGSGGSSTGSGVAGSQSIGVSYGPWYYQSGITGGKGNSGGYWARTVIDANGFHTERSSTDPSKGPITPVSSDSKKPAKTGPADQTKNAPFKPEVSSLGNDLSPGNSAFWSDTTQELMNEGFFGPDPVAPTIRITIPDSVLSARSTPVLRNMTGASRAPTTPVVSANSSPVALPLPSAAPQATSPTPSSYTYTPPKTNGGSTITGLSNSIKIDPTFLGGKYGSGTQSKTTTAPPVSSLGTTSVKSPTVSITTPNSSVSNASPTSARGTSIVSSPPVKFGLSSPSSTITTSTPAVRSVSLATPSIKTPTVNLRTPALRTPTVRVSNITVRVPMVRVPTVRVPTVRVPTVRVPTVRVPTIRINVPTVRTPTISSDIRLKRDIVMLGELPSGLHVYRFRYIGDSELYVGVMAQEVTYFDPDAVVEGDDGFLRVDYTRLGFDFMTWDQWNIHQTIEAALPNHR